MATELAAVVGETLMDVIRHPGEAPIEHPGGSPLNVAVGLGRLGHPSMLVTWMGDDERGRTIREHLNRSGVTLVPGATGAARTSTANITMDEQGELDYSFDMLWHVPPVPAGIRPHVVHAASIGAVYEPGAEEVYSFVEASRDHATITYDPNIRPHAMGRPEDVRHLVERLVAVSDVTKVSAEDLGWLYPARNPEKVAAEWAGHGGLVVLTKGDRGSAAFRERAGRSRSLRVLPGYCETFVDAVGAGDSFMAGLIHALWRKGVLGAERRREMLDLDDSDVVDALCVASSISAITVQRPGADPPWLSEVDDRTVEERVEHLFGGPVLA